MVDKSTDQGSSNPIGDLHDFFDGVLDRHLRMQSLPNNLYIKRLRLRRQMERELALAKPFPLYST